MNFNIKIIKKQNRSGMMNFRLKKTYHNNLTTIPGFYPQFFYLFSFFTIFNIENYEKLIQKKVATLHKHLNFSFRSYY